ncbi:HvfC/BufC N-terminal domain-containing protein [Halostreptopolyspora alba]|uniref:DUF2063 domain-containing protein n=1 Tax=Halostreptopolyspora alba TaxID=2487137 RepID=A0A3N0EDU6_9ACTN|nr:DUF2063 domain-containing protein [Nocardiopsaceae bacterium YIM 96095]
MPMSADTSAGALQRTQEWVQTALLAPEATTGAADVVTASSRLTAEQRLAVYQQGYRARLVECMRAHYPVLGEVLGADLFTEFALGYLRSRPSRNYTLADLGDGFADYLQRNRPEGDPDREEDHDWVDSLIDLARFERAFAESYAAPDAQESTADEETVLPDPHSTAWAGTVLLAAPCVRLVRAGFAVHRFAAAIRQGEEPPPPGGPVSLLLARCGFAVIVAELETGHHELLSAVLAGHSCGAATARSGLSVPAADAVLRQWAARRLLTIRAPLASP